MHPRVVGSPPFDYSDGSSKRKSGFLSADTLLNENGETMFVPCKSVKQCFEDKFTHHGQEVTRRVFIEASSQGPGRRYVPSHDRTNNTAQPLFKRSFQIQ